MSKRWCALPLCGFLLACANDAAPSAAEPVLSQRDQPIVYGNDDRRELYEETAAMRELGRNAVVALMGPGALTVAATGEVKLKSVQLSVAYHLCDGERFREQPTASECTGVLIDDDLVLTAGHCLEGVQCSDYHFVFDYFYRGEKQLEPLSAADVYGCRRLVAHEISARNGRMIDYAVVQLDRPARDRRPLPLGSAKLQAGQPLTVLGTGSGLPMKVDRGASVLEARSAENDFFMLEADTFEGSSGSAIIDAQGELLGVLVRGGEDYAMNVGESCNRVNRLDKATVVDVARGELAHEEATYAAAAVAGLCDAGFPSARLCDIEPRCGDTFCSADESRESCAQDCDPCADGACGARGSRPSSAGDAVKQGAGSGRTKDAGCTLTPGLARAPAGAALWLALSTLLWTRRRRAR